MIIYDGMSIFLLVTWNMSPDKTTTIKTSLEILTYLNGATEDFVFTKQDWSWPLVKKFPFLFGW